MSPPSFTDSGLAGSVAVVSGGSRGIGRAIVETLAAAGMTVTFTYRAHAAAAAEVVAAGAPGNISAEAVDVRDAAACAAFVERILDRTDRVDLLVNNAGVIRDNPVGLLEDEDVRVVLDTNVVGAFNLTRAVVPAMIAARRGKIINLCSLMSEASRPTTGNYTAAKGGLKLLTKAMCVEWGPHNIQANGIGPGYILSDLTRHLTERP